MDGERLWVLIGHLHYLKDYPTSEVRSLVVASYDIVDPENPRLIDAREIGNDPRFTVEATTRPRMVRNGDGHWLVAPLYPAPVDLTDASIVRDFTCNSSQFYFATPQLFIAPDIWIACSHAGLTLLKAAEWRRPPSGPAELISEARVVGSVSASPLAWAFRSDYPKILSAGPNRIWEIHDTHAIAYDVSDPTRPRRIAHVTTHKIVNAVSGPRFLVLDHGVGFSIVLHPQ